MGKICSVCEDPAGQSFGGMSAQETHAQYAPSAHAVREILKTNKITGGDAARMMYLSGSRQVRKYTGGKNPRQMDGARWFCLHAHIILSTDQIRAIEASMTAAL